MYNIGPKFNGKFKGGHHSKIYVVKTRPTSEILHEYRLVQGWDWGGDSTSRWISGGKKYIGKRKGP